MSQSLVLAAIACAGQIFSLARQLIATQKGLGSMTFPMVSFTRFVPLLAFSALVLAGGESSGQSSGEAPMELPQADRAKLDEFLGEGVVGEAIAGNPIADASEFFTFEPGSWSFLFTSGDSRGQINEQSFTRMTREGAEEKGKYQNGEKMTHFLSRSSDGSISVVSEQDAEQGVISRFSPPQPIYIAGLEPGRQQDLRHCGESL